MKKLIKAAMIYKATIPTDRATLEAHLSEKAFSECMPSQLQSVGFVPPIDDTEQLVQPFPGGLAFRVRIDGKIIPASTVAAEVASKIKDQFGDHKVGKKERAIIKESVITDLCQRALVMMRASLTCFYHTESGYLIIPTTNATTADVCTGLLVQAVGSIKTETINVSNAKHGLTKRLNDWLVGDETAFGDFEPCDGVTLAAEGKKITLKMSSLDDARSGIDEALARGFQVEAIGFHKEDMDFKLSHNFRLRGVSFPDQDIPEEEEDLWEADAAMQVKSVVSVVETLCDMLSYKEETKEAA